ncbi:MAG: DoxX family protein [Bacteroidota bacterium]
MKRDKIVYWVATDLLSLMMTGSATMYILQYEEVARVFTAAGFPTYIIYFLATCKFLGVLAILTKKSRMLKEWAYAGFFFNFCLAFMAHMNSDGALAAPIITMILLFISYFMDKQVFS